MAALDIILANKPRDRNHSQTLRISIILQNRGLSNFLNLIALINRRLHPYVVDLSVVMRTSAVRLKCKKLHLTFREWLLSILNDVSITASRLRADEIGIVTDFYSHLFIKDFTRNTHGSSS